jgi:hypothetical protein
MREELIAMPGQAQDDNAQPMSAADIAAREFAHIYNYGVQWAVQPSPLHVLATTGAIEHDRCIEEIEHSLADLPRGTSTVTLDELRAYIETIGDRPSVPGWVALRPQPSLVLRQCARIRWRSVPATTNSTRGRIVQGRDGLARNW